MKGGFYPKLALGSIRKNAKTYVPYILTCIACVTALYITSAMAMEPRWPEVDGGVVTQVYLSVGLIIISIFSLVFLFYTNSFLIKRRKKEFGLYNVLGMGKRHIAKSVAYETLFIALGSIIVGIALGVVLGKLAMLLMLKLVAVETIFSLDFSLMAAGFTAGVFGTIFLLNLLVNIIRVGRTKTIDLLYGGRVGEKEPKSNIPMAILGAVCLISGYILALMVKDAMQALLLFFVAVILVIVGTYATIMAGSTVVLKLMKRNKGFYYKPGQFISVSGMLYRMKQNAAGIGSICILFTMLLVTVSTTGCMYFGIDNMVNERINRDVMYSVGMEYPTDIEKYKAFVQELEKEGYGLEDSFVAGYSSAYVQHNGNSIEYTGGGYSATSVAAMIFTQEDYISYGGQGLDLKDNQISIDFFDKQHTGEMQVQGKAFETVELPNPEILRDIGNYQKATGSFIMVVKDEAAAAQIFGEREPYKSLMIGFNLKDKTQSEAAAELLREKIHSSNLKSYSEPFTRGSMANELRSFLGSFLFLGAFLGILFLMATVLIMYYKQISEGYDDKQRFEIMEKVGMSKKEIRKTIKTQVLMIFFIPILFSIIHLGFAVKMIFLILGGFGLTNINVLLMYTGASVAIFAFIYLLAYVFTARSYYKIVK